MNTGMNTRISLVVATKDRPEDLRRTLESLAAQSMPPDEIIVVDASTRPVLEALEQHESGQLCIKYLRHLPPSASAQRNAGISACSEDATHIGFADDDTFFEPRAFERMRSFWSSAPDDVLGAGFNLRNYPERGRAILKHSALAEQMGIYGSRPGQVALSGWQTIIPELPQNTFVDWLPTTAVLFRSAVFSSVEFDPYYESYSYLEDLDLSYSVGRQGRLAIVADAGYEHFPSSAGRISGKEFGRFEVRNRLHFVRKHKLSVPRCNLALLARIAMSFATGIESRDGFHWPRALSSARELLRQWLRPDDCTALDAAVQSGRGTS